MSSPVVLRKAQIKRKPCFDDDDENENHENLAPQIINPFDDFSQSQSTIETTISLQKAPCEEQSNSQASFTSSRRRLQRISDKRQPLEIRYEEEIQPIVKKEEGEICEIEYSKPNNKKEVELDSLVGLFNKCSQSSVNNHILEQGSNLIECEGESEDEEAIEEEHEDIVPKKSLAEIPDLIRINSLIFSH